MTDRRTFLKTALAAGAALIVPARSMAEALEIAGRPDGLYGYEPPLTEQTLRRLCDKAWLDGFGVSTITLSSKAMLEFIGLVAPERRYRVGEPQSIGFVDLTYSPGVEDTMMFYDHGRIAIEMDAAIPDGFVRIDPEVKLAV